MIDRQRAEFSHHRAFFIRTGDADHIHPGEAAKLDQRHPHTAGRAVHGHRAGLRAARGVIQ
ncbi:MAG: hypothetical protein WDN48_10580 [Pseudolabrys sp.]